MLQLKLEDIYHFSDDSVEVVGVRTGGKWGFIDKTGKIVIEPQFEDS